MIIYLFIRVFIYAHLISYCYIFSQIFNFTGGVQAIGELLTLVQSSSSIRRYACMTLTNLTFGDGANKALLCGMTSTLCSIVGQLTSTDNDLRQV